mmetsp:Transcript_24497/g.68682  ORF Transcript_24497/g.68682 Transcript_24497/m.68682 type:complete len:202 (-) Transcript_24497:403-1008(-)|eukprot:scaffold105655_cov32-Tisochrysis_lutea.AAC.2
MFGVSPAQPARGCRLAARTGRGPGQSSLNRPWTATPAALERRTQRCPPPCRVHAAPRRPCTWHMLLGLVWSTAHRRPCAARVSFPTRSRSPKAVSISWPRRDCTRLARGPCGRRPNWLRWARAASQAHHAPSLRNQRIGSQSGWTAGLPWASRVRHEKPRATARSFSAQPCSQRRRAAYTDLGQATQPHWRLAHTACHAPS